MGNAIRGLLAFHDRYLVGDADAESLPEELKHIYSALASSFAKNLLDEMRQNEKRHFLTAGSEGEIYRFRTDSGDFIIAKRRFDSRNGISGTDKECDLQRAARKIAKTCDGVAVPKIFSRIPDPEQGWEYIVMECVRGKTLWTLALESLANAEQSAQFALDISAEIHPILRFYEDRSRFLIKYDNDTEAELGIIEHYREIAAKTGQPDPGLRVREADGRTSFPNLKSSLDANLAKVPVFSSAAIAHIVAKLRPFLTKLHEQGIYHRDLNVRNLMIGEDGLIYVIDFGKGARSTPNDDSVYDAQEGKHDNDFSVIDLLKSYGPKAETEADRLKRMADGIKAGITPERVRIASVSMGLNPDDVAASVGRISQKFGIKYFENLFKQYVDGIAERTHPTTFIRMNPKKPEAVKATEAGKRQLIAYMLLIERDELENLLAYFDSIGKQLSSEGHPPLFGSAAKDARAEKYLPLFETAVIAAMG
jgi:tRNA A-37 threonylcarbamoyl transferase component Bud32